MVARTQRARGGPLSLGAARVTMALALGAWLASVGGCDAPRDLDLERRIDQELARREAAKSASPGDAAAPKAEATGPKRSAAGASTAPPKGSVDIRSYSDKEIAKYLAAVPGQGPVLHMTLDTAEGPIRCTLDRDHAPQTVANLVALATGQIPWRDPDTGEVERGRFYDGLTFHRAIEGFIIQTGNPAAGAGAGGPGWTIPREAGAAGAFDKPGTLAMVDAGEDSHGSQFFLTLKPAKHLVGKYTPFGRCGDLGLARRIAARPKKPAAPGKSASHPVTPVDLTRLTLSWGPPL